MRKNVLIVIISLLVIWLIVLSVIIGENLKTTNSSNAIVNEYNVSGFSTDLSKVVDSSKSKIVAVEQDGVFSSGFIYKKENDNVYLLTCFHGVSGSNGATVYFNNGLKVSGNVVGYDIFTDLALVECYFPYEVEEMEFGDSDLVKSGEFALSIGTNSDLQYDFSTCFGLISSKYREVNNSITFNEENYNYVLGTIQLSGNFTNGYSGAALLNMDGETIGIITMKDGDITLALTINEAKIVAEKLYAKETIKRIDLGVKGKYISDLENYETNSLNIPLDVTNGYYVSDISLNSLANNIGIIKGDVITEINDIKINSFKDMLNIIYGNYDVINITVVRNNETITLSGNIYD